MKAQGDEMTATGDEHADCADGPGRRQRLNAHFCP